MGILAPGERTKTPTLTPEQQKEDTLAGLTMERERWLETRERMRRSGAKHSWNPKLGEVEYLAPDSDMNKDWRRTDGRMNHLLGALSTLNAGVGFEYSPEQTPIPVNRVNQTGVEVPIDYSQFNPEDIDGA